MIVVKMGGSEGIEQEGVCADIAELVGRGERVIVVHGGSHLTNEVATALGHPPQFVTSPSGYTSRLTDRRTLEIFEMVYCGQVNKGLVERLQAAGVNAIGLSGIDGKLWQGPRKESIRIVENGKTRIIRDSLTGKVEKVNLRLLYRLLDSGFTPVLTPPALSYNGEAMNVDGDRAAAMTAIAMRASCLLILSNVPGVLREFPDETSLIREIPGCDMENVMRDYAQGRMRIKLLGAQEALDGGVKRIVVGDARGEHPILRALEGAGTVITA
jgi:acetylglutamate/LysW-gamma-L-alpha-aminoadipate kinase